MISRSVHNLRDPLSLDVKSQLERLTEHSAPILIYGETGTGKDFWAEYFHSLFPEKPFVNLNCGDVPETLLESEWFGYKRGAFTGADEDRDGKWRKGDKGILFLNQIDLLPLHLQAKLLRIIERKQYFPLGSNSEVGIDVRFLFSTDADIEEKVKNGNFRADLFYRISTMKIFLHPLRERPKDLFSLSEFFSAEKKVRLELSEQGREMFVSYPWPGNIRELENLFASASLQSGSVTDSDVERLYSQFHHFYDMVTLKEPTLASLEAMYIRHLMEKHRKKSRVAKILGISRKSLYNKLKQYETS